ncbi:MAG: hypothetical protein ACR5LA_13735 [Wolbachia sp.]
MNKYCLVGSKRILRVDRWQVGCFSEALSAHGVERRLRGGD